MRGRVRKGLQIGEVLLHRSDAKDRIAIELDLSESSKEPRAESVDEKGMPMVTGAVVERNLTQSARAESVYEKGMSCLLIGGELQIGGGFNSGEDF